MSFRLFNTFFPAFSPVFLSKFVVDKFPRVLFLYLPSKLNGAVGVECDRLGLTEKLKNIALKQATATVGKSRLMGIYDNFFSSRQQAIARSGKSLLAAGIKQIEGDFAVTDAVEICNLQGVSIARSLVNYNSIELEKIQGCQSHEIPQILGYDDLPETFIHRDNLVVIN